MNTPIILICGAAGSGKDTIAKFLAEKYNGICIAQSDPMKRFAGVVFGFNETKLWGPSEERNSPQEDLESVFYWPKGWTDARERLIRHSDQIFDVLEAYDADKTEAILDALTRWFDSVRLHYAATRGNPTPRYVLQTLGTEFGRAFSKDMWSAFAIRTAQELLGGGYSYSRAAGLGMDRQAMLDHVIITDGRFLNELVNVKFVGGQVVMVTNPLPIDNTALHLGGIKGHASEAELTGIPASWIDIRFINDKGKGLASAEATVVNVLGKALFKGPKVLGA